MTPATKTALWIIGILVVLIGGYAYLSREGGALDTNTATSTDSVVACTMEARLCPDGSYVGRSGPKCEFTPCPTVSTSTGTTSGASNNVSGSVSGDVMYPADWGK